jgi:hypothetical protein
MRLNTDTTPAALTLPRLGSKLEALADYLARFALEFGVVNNGYFAGRLGTIAFSNAIVLGLRFPEAASRLEQLLVLESIPADSELPGLASEFAADLKGEEDWTREVNFFLQKRWNASAESKTAFDSDTMTRLRVLFSIRSGLVVARERAEAAAKVAEHIKSLWFENQFLANLLLGWGKNDWIPYNQPFIEFTASWYRNGTVEQAVVGRAVGEHYWTAKALNNPWSVAFWAETGWNGGRSFVGRRPEDCKALLQEAGDKLLEGYHELYKRTVLATAGSDGDVQILRATLKYIGEHENPILARNHCTGREPRLLALNAFDFAFWMGIFSAHPLPTEGS